MSAGSPVTYGHGGRLWHLHHGGCPPHGGHLRHPAFDTHVEPFRDGAKKGEQYTAAVPFAVTARQVQQHRDNSHSGCVRHCSEHWAPVAGRQAGSLPSLWHIIRWGAELAVTARGSCMACGSVRRQLKLPGPVTTAVASCSDCSTAQHGSRPCGTKCHGACCTHPGICTPDAEHQGEPLALQGCPERLGQVTLQAPVAGGAACDYGHSRRPHARQTPLD